MRREHGRRAKKRVCNFCVDGVSYIDYKDTRQNAQVHYRARQDIAQENNRQLRKAPASSHKSNQESQSNGTNAVYYRVTDKTEVGQGQQPMPEPAANNYVGGRQVAGRMTRSLVESALLAALGSVLVLVGVAKLPLLEAYGFVFLWYLPSALAVLRHGTR